MKIRLSYILFLLFILLFSCKKNADKKTIISPKKIVKKTILKNNLDSLNHLNVVAFFTEYGKQNTETKVVFKTRLGDIKILLYKNTPIHRANFIFLTKKGYFNTTCFHRVVPNFIAQGGDSELHKTVNFRNKYKQYKLPSEFRKNRRHKRGAIAAARDWENNPNKVSTPFEFYFIQNKKGGHHLDFEHTVFGEVISGMHVIDKITLLERDKDDWPYVDVFITAQVIN